MILLARVIIRVHIRRYQMQQTTDEHKKYKKL